MDAASALLALAVGRHGHVDMQTACVRLLLTPLLLPRLADVPQKVSVLDHEQRAITLLFLRVRTLYLDHSGPTVQMQNMLAKHASKSTLE